VIEPLRKPERVNDLEDPVCHQHVATDTRYKSSYRGHTIYFCSKSCKTEFDQTPSLWLSVSHAEMSSANFGME
jgi:YHS domain-containing protein